METWRRTSSLKLPWRLPCIKAWWVEKRSPCCFLKFCKCAFATFIFSSFSHGLWISFLFFVFYMFLSEESGMQKLHCTMYHVYVFGLPASELVPSQRVKWIQPCWTHPTRWTSQSWILFSGFCTLHNVLKCPQVLFLLLNVECGYNFISFLVRDVLWERSPTHESFFFFFLSLWASLVCLIY